MRRSAVNRTKKTLGLATAVAGGALIGGMFAAPVAGAVSSVAATISGSTLTDHSVTGNKLKNHTLTGTQVKPNSLTGAQIKESTLGAVPKANKLAFLPSKHSESGTYAVGGGSTDDYWMGVSVTFPQPLAKTIPAANVIWVGGGANPNCPGVGHAAPGYMCLYDAESDGIAGYLNRDDLLPAAPGNGMISWFEASAADAYAAGTWTVTAP
jgi:hypothetical protein